MELSYHALHQSSYNVIIWRLTMKALLGSLSIIFLMSFVLIGCVTETSEGNKNDTRNEGIQEIVNSNGNFLAVVVNK